MTRRALTEEMAFLFNGGQGFSYEGCAMVTQAKVVALHWEDKTTAVPEATLDVEHPNAAVQAGDRERIAADDAALAADDAVLAADGAVLAADDAVLAADGAGSSADGGRKPGEKRRGSALTWPSAS